MTVSTTSNKNLYNGNGSTKDFAYTYRILDATHLKVQVDSGSGLVDMVYPTQYTVSGVGVAGGGTVSFVTAPVAGASNVVIQRLVPLTQLTDYVANDSFPAETHEAALDLIVMALQQLQEQIDRAFVAPINYTGFTGDILTAVETAATDATTAAADAATARDTAQGYAASAGNIGRHTISVEGQAFVPRSNGTTSPSLGSRETTTNKIQIRSLNFDGGSADEYAQRRIAMPKSWNEGTVTARFTWTNASGTGNVVWGIRAVALGDDDVLDAAPGTGVTVQDSVTAVGDIMVSAETSALTIAGTPQPTDQVVFEVYRKASDTVNDTLTVDAELLSVEIFYTAAVGNDA